MKDSGLGLLKAVSDELRVQRVRPSAPSRRRRRANFKGLEAIKSFGDLV